MFDAEDESGRPVVAVNDDKGTVASRVVGELCGGFGGHFLNGYGFVLARLLAVVKTFTSRSSASACV